MRIVILLVLIFSAHLGWTQKESMPVKKKFMLLKNKVSKQTDKADGIKLPALKDSIRVSVPDSLKKKNFFSRLKDKTNSLRQNVNQPDASRRIAFEKPTVKLDTVQQPILPNINNLPTDSVKRKTEAVSNTIKDKAPHIQETITSKSDSLGVADKIKSLQEKLLDKTDLKLPDQGNQNPIDGLKLPSVNSNPDVKTPGLSTDQSKIPGTDILKDIPVMPGIKLPDQNTGLPNTNIPELDATGKVKEELNLPTNNIPQLNKPDSSQLNQIKEKAFEDERLKKYAEPVEGVSEKLDPYKKNLDSLNVQDASTIANQEAENVLGNTAVMKEINSNVQQGKAAMTVPHAAVLQRYQDKRILKDEMLRKSKNVMNDKITSLTPQVKEQQQKFGKTKKLNSSVQSIKNMPKKRTNELKEKPFYERLVPGISLQSYTSNVFSIDLAPQLGYRISTPWTIGAGMLYRVGFDRKYDYFVQGQGVYGFKTFINYRLIKELFVHGEFEKIAITKRFSYSDKAVPTEINNSYLGLGKRYPISRKFYASLLALYKIEMGDHLPGSTKFNLRIVLEYKTKKVRKPTDL